MRIINASYEILDELNGEEILKKIERIARVCYKSEDRIKPGSAEKMVGFLIKNGHEAMLEHFSFSVKFIVDRGVSHEIVRHRLASFAQESTRYCDYGNKDGEITVILPCWMGDEKVNKNCDIFSWMDAMKTCEKKYLDLLDRGWEPQKARTVLPNSLKTEVVMTANLREWRHFLKLRACGTTGKPHPQMLEITVPLLLELKEKIPVIFDDLDVKLLVKNSGPFLEVDPNRCQDGPKRD